MAHVRVRNVPSSQRAHDGACCAVTLAKEPRSVCTAFPDARFEHPKSANFTTPSRPGAGMNNSLSSPFALGFSGFTMVRVHRCQLVLRLSRPGWIYWPARKIFEAQGAILPAQIISPCISPCKQSLRQAWLGFSSLKLPHQPRRMLAVLMSRWRMDGLRVCR